MVRYCKGCQPQCHCPTRSPFSRGRNLENGACHAERSEASNNSYVRHYEEILRYAQNDIVFNIRWITRSSRMMTLWGNTPSSEIAPPQAGDDVPMAVFAKRRTSYCHCEESAFGGRRSNLVGQSRGIASVARGDRSNDGEEGSQWRQNHMSF